MHIPYNKTHFFFTKDVQYRADKTIQNIHASIWCDTCALSWSKWVWDLSSRDHTGKPNSTLSCIDQLNQQNRDLAASVIKIQNSCQRQQQIKENKNVICSWVQSLSNRWLFFFYLSIRERV